MEPGPGRDTRRAKEHFLRLVELDPERRQEALAQLDREEPDLARRVRGLLEAHAGAERSGLDELHERFRRLLRGLGDAAPEGAEAAGAEVPPRLGDHELLEELAAGSSGVVYRARQRSLDRQVALKLLRADALVTRRQVERFRIEAELVARLDHPAIVPVYEVGSADGRPYFSMKLIEGGDLSRHLPALRRDLRRGARLLAEVARAVHHGHERGLLHRDLKPSNILLDEQGRPYVADFGIARDLDEAGRAERGTEWFAGTPAYMAPEQTDRRDLTVATDVYALGCILYELLAGHPPFRAGSLADLVTALREQPPPPLPRDVPRDLATIALECLRKEPERRYASARELAEDLERWCAREPIRARRVGPLARALLLARRRPLVSALATLVALLVTTLAVGGTWASMRLGQGLERTRGALRASFLAEATALRHGRRTGWRAEALARLRSAAAIAPGDDLRDEAVACLAAPDLEALPGELRGELLAVDAVAGRALCRTPEGLELVELDREGRGGSWSVPGAEPLAAVPGPHGDTVLVSSGGPRGPAVHLLELPACRERWSLPLALAGDTVAFDEHGERLALGLEGGEVLLLAAADGRELLRLEAEPPGRVLALAPGPAGELLAVSRSAPARVRLHRLPDGELLEELALEGLVRDLAWLPGGELALAAGDFDVHLWRPGEQRTRTLRGHRSEVVALHPCGPGPLLASYSWDATTLVWNTVAAEPLLRLAVEVVDVDPAGGRFLRRTAGGVRPARLAHGEVFQGLHGHRGKSPTSVDLSTDGRTIASAGDDGVVLWSRGDGRELARLAIADAGEVLFAPDGATLFVFASSGVHALDLPLPARGGPPAPRLLADVPVRRATRTPSGHLAAARLDDGGVLLLDREGRTVDELGPWPALDQVALAHDGSWVVGGNWGGAGVALWRPGVREEPVDLLPGASSVVPFASPTESIVLLCGAERVTCLELPARRVRWTRERDPGVVGRCGPAAFSPDGRLVVLSLGSEDLLLVDVEDGRTLGRLEPPRRSPLARIAFGRETLAVATHSGHVQVWRLDRLGRALRELDLGGTPGPLGRW